VAATRFPQLPTEGTRQRWQQRPRWVRWGAYAIGVLLGLAGFRAIVGDADNGSSEPAGTLLPATPTTDTIKFWSSGLLAFRLQGRTSMSSAG
jgi:hypothetical protein